MTEKSTSLMACWFQAKEEHPNDPELARARYVQLMQERGFTVPVTAANPHKPLACGYDPTRRTE